MDQEHEDSIVAALMLLFDGIEPDRIQRLAAMAIPNSKKGKWVCEECGSDHMSYTADVEWMPERHEWDVNNHRNYWCSDCDMEVSDMWVPIDWKKSDEEDEEDDAAA